MNNDPNPIVEDWGQITSAAVTFDDFGSVTEVWTAYEVWTTEYLYVGSGTLFELGNGLERQLAPYVGSGTVRFSGSGSVVRRSAISVSGFVPFFDGDSAEDLGGAIYGLPTNYANYGTVVDPIESVDNGGVVGVDLTPLVEERYTFSYNLSSVTASSQADFNYELITQTPTSIDDYLSIDIPGANIDYGFTSESPVYPTVNPFGLVSIFGDALVSFSDNATEGIALFSITGDAIIASPLQAYVTGIGNVTLNGIADTDRIRSYVGSGVVSGISGSAESFTVSLNTTQLFVVTGQVSQSFSKGLYTGSGSLFGFNGYTNFKYINAVDETTGLFKIFGASVEKQTESYNESSTVDYNWGFVNEIPTSTEDYENPILPWNNLPEDFGSVLSISTQDLLPFGSIIFLSSAFEANTESYNESSIFDGQYGFIDQSPSVIIDNGYSEGLGASAYPVDYLTIDIPVSIETPFGFSTIFGSASSAKIANPPENTILFNLSGAGLTRVPFQQWQGSGQSKIFGDAIYAETDSFVGSGVVSGLSGSAEVFGANPPENTQLFSVTGNGIYRETAVEVGSGSITVSSSAIEAFIANPFETTQLFVTTGSTTYSETDVFVGSGSLVISGVADVDRIRSSESTILFTAFGSSVNKETDAEVGSGSITAFGSADIIFSTGAGESTILFNIVGSGNESNTESYNESSNVQYDWGFVNEFAIESEDYEDSVPVLPWITGPEDFGSLLDVATGNINPFGAITVFGSATEANTESYNESAIFISDFGSITDSVTIIEDNQIVSGNNAFVLNYGLLEDAIASDIPYGNTIYTGIASTSEIATYTALGSGVINAAGSAVIRVRLDIRYFGSGNYTFFGNGLDSETDVEVGSGSLRFSDAGAEVFGANPPESIQLFNLSGSAITSEIAVNTEIGSGTINAFGSADIAFTADADESTILFNLFGIAAYNETNSEVGSGSFRFSDVGAEVFGANPPESIQLFNLSGSAITSEIAVNTEIGSGTINVSGSADVAFARDSVESTILFNLFGSAEDSESESYEGLGLITTFGNAFESNTESYNESAIFDSNFGSITDPATLISYGFVNEIADIESYGVLDDIIISDIPYGFVVSSGIAETAEISKQVFEGSGSITTSGFAVINFTTGAGESTILFNITGSGIEKNTESYNESSVVEYNWGLVAEFASGSEDYEDSIPVLPWVIGPEDFGSLVDAATGNINPFGSVTTFFGAAEAFGANPQENTQLFDLSGSAITTEIAAYTKVGSGFIIASGNASVAFSSDAGESTILFTLSGAADTDRVRVSDSTILFNLSGSAIESNTESYNESSIFDGDFGSIVDTAILIENGNIIDNNPSLLDYGFLEDIAITNVPYGVSTLFGSAIVSKVADTPEETQLFVFSGAAKIVSKLDIKYAGSGFITAEGDGLYSETAVEVGSGSFRFSDVGAEVFGANPPENTQLFSVSGAAVYSETDAEVGSGSISTFSGAAEAFIANPLENTQLFSITGSGIEKNTESYNESSVVEYDWGIVSEFASGSEDYEDSIPVLPWVIGPEDFGSLANAATGDINPFGAITIFAGAAEVFAANPTENTQLFDLSGSALTSEIAAYTAIGSGSIGVVSGAAEVFGANPPENTQLFSLSGNAIYVESDAFSGSGSIAAFGSAIEKNTESYNEFSIFDGDYGLVTDPAEDLDYGFIIDPAQIINYGLLDDTVISNTPFGYVVSSGVAVTAEIATYRKDGSGSIITSGAANIVSKLEIKYSGSGLLVFSESGAEVFGANPPENTQLFNITGNATTAEFAVFTAAASGQTNFFGNASYKEIDAYSGSGSINVVGSGGIVFSPSIDETVLFNITGSAAEKHTESYNESAIIEYDWGFVNEFATESEDYEDSIPVLPWITGPEDFGSITNFATQNVRPYGSITTFGSAIEKNTESYNESSIFDGDYGLITDPATVVDNGIVIDVDTTDITYGQINDVVVANTPYGTSVFLGQASSVKNTESYVGSGSINVVGSGGIVFSPSIDETVLFNITGSGSHSETDVFAGSGQLVISGIASTKLTSFYTFVGTGASNFFGSASHRETDTEVGSGTIGFVSGAAEVFGANPPENTQLFSITGAAIYSETDVFNGSGSIATSGGNIYSETNTFNGFGQITLSGNLNESESEVFIGSGISRFSGAARIVSRLDIRYKGDAGNSHFFGAGAYSETDVEVGSGSLRFSDAGAEVFGANPPENTQLFSVTGVASYSETDVEVGSGFISTLSGAVEAFVANPPENTQLFRVTGVGAYSETDIEIGSGFLRFSDAGAEVFGANPPENTQLFSITGAGVYKETASEIGSGFINATGGNIYRETSAFNGSGQINISGNAFDSESEAFNGSGFFRFSDAGAEIFGANPPENTQLFTITGVGAYSETDVEIGDGTKIISGAADVVGISSYSKIGSGEINITGFGAYSETDAEVGSGFLRFSDTSAEVFGANPPENTQLFSIAGVGLYSETDTEVGSGSITIFSGATEVFSANPPENTQLFRVTGVGAYSETDVEVGSGSFKFSDAGAEVFGANPPENTQLFSIAGFGAYSETAVEVGSGSINITGTGVYSETDTFTGSGQIIISGNALDSESEVFTGSGSIRFSDAGAEVFGANPPENTQLFAIAGIGVYSETDVEVGSGSIFTSGSADIKFTSGAGESTILFNLSGVANYSETDIEVGSGQAVFSGAASTAEYAVYTATTSGTINLSGVAETREIATYQDYVTSGEVTLSGAALQKFVPSYDGSGVISTVSGAAEVFGANPPENIQLFELSGEAQTKKQINVQEVSVGPQYVFSGAATDLKRSHAYTEFVGAIRYTDLSNSLVKHTESYVGSGIISAVSGAAEVFGANPPENTQLFTASGSASTRETNLYRETGSGTETVTGIASVNLSKSEVGFATPIVITGGFDIVIRLIIFGEGVISALSGAAEVYGPNPPENTQLFNVTGAATTQEKNLYQILTSGQTTISGSGQEKNTESYIGSGVISTVSGAADVFGANPPENTQLFAIEGVGSTREINTYQKLGSGTVVSSGQSTTLRAQAVVGSGEISITGKQTSPAEFRHFGSGSLFATGGTAEVFGANPVEQTLLHRFAGAAKDSHTEKYAGVGNINITGVALDINTESYVGQGDVSSVSGAAEVFGSNPPENTLLFNITGSAITRKAQQQSYIGAVDAEISGVASDVKTNAFVGIGIIGLYPEGQEKNTESYVGSGNIANVGGSAISKGANPQEETSLYQVSGSASTKVISSFITTGSASLQGNAVEKNTEKHVGSGQITISGTTSGQYGIVSLSNTVIFNIKGDSKARVRFAPVCDVVTYTYGSESASSEVRSFDPPSLFVAIF